MSVRVFIFLLSGLFCCLGFSGGIYFAVWAGAVFFLLFGRGPRPRPNSKKNMSPPKQQKKTKNAPRPFRACCFFLLFGRVGVLFFFCLGGGACFFLLFGWGACSFFCCLGGGVLFFCCLGGDVFFFFADWAGGVFFFAVWAADRSSLTYPSAWLVFKRPNNKRDRTAKEKKHPGYVVLTNGMHKPLNPIGVPSFWPQHVYRKATIDSSSSKKRLNHLEVWRHGKPLGTLLRGHGDLVSILITLINHIIAPAIHSLSPHDPPSRHT